jgi:hypothetical protein
VDGRERTGIGKGRLQGGGLRLLKLELLLLMVELGLKVRRKDVAGGLRLGGLRGDGETV